MCNPPFYDSAASLLASAAAKTLPPSSACTGTPGEMVYEDGGELGFARRMLEESLVFRERVGWYTTLFGKLASVGGFVECLKREGVENWVIGEMVQGTTRRWVVAWSYGDRRVQGSKSAGLRGCSPPGPGLEFAFRVGRGVGEVGKEVAGLLEGLEMCVYKTDPERGELYGEVKGNVWSRAARRAAARGMDVVKDGQEEVKLGFLVQVGKEDGGTVVKVVWKRGRDPVLFESLCGMVKRKLVLEK